MLAEKKVAIEGRQQDIKERKTYAGRIFWLVVAWLVFVGCILIAHGARWPWTQYLGFTLPDAVLIALITTTTGGVVGILLIVVQYLFPRRSKKVD